MKSKKISSKTLNFLIVIGFTFTTLTACNSGGNPKSNAPSDAEVTETGIKYKFYEKAEDARKAKKGDFITFHLIIENSKDSILRSTYDEGMPFLQVPLRTPRNPGSFEESLLMLSEGDSASFWINIDSIKDGERPPFIEEGSDVHYIVKVLRIQSEAEVTKELEENLKNQRTEDKRLITEYIKKQEGKEFAFTQSGLAYYISEAGTGKQAQVGDTVTVSYTGRLLNGQVFDSSEGKPPFEFPLGRGFVIKGWDEGISLLKIGDKATFVIPSELAYGSRGAGDLIPPNTVLVFDVELVGVK